MTGTEAYLEYQNRRIPVESPFKLGRSKHCALPVDDPQASREHAMIVRDPHSGRWLLTDLSSTNGTYLNGQPLIGTERLKGNDSFSIGKQKFTFFTSADVALETQSTLCGRTSLSIERHVYWLVLADISGSTKLVQELPLGEASLKIRQWINECRPALVRARCAINEYLGDGFLAVSREEQTTPEAMLSLLEEFTLLRSQTGLVFRVVVHFGELQTGAGVSSGAEKLSGKELNFLFKSEKAVAKFGARTNVTEAALRKLGWPASFGKVAEVQLDGFEGIHVFHTWRDSPDSPDSAG